MEFSLVRVWTVILRYFYSYGRNINKSFEFFFWPLIDTVLFGFIGMGTSDGSHPELLAGLLVGLILWQITQRTSMEISRNLLQEIWDENLVNFFATPLTIFEWITGLLSLGFIITFLITIPYAALIVYGIFGYNLFALGWLLLPSILLLIVSGWILGFIAASMLIYWGQQIDILVWALPWLPTPFCSIYYPVAVLPKWMQLISKGLPMSYVFEGLRFTIRTGQTSYWHLGMSATLNILYLLITLSLFFYMFKKSKAKGLGSF
ncbi:MAG: ABC transporter permease [Candidatus Babeliales bacterium]|nr:ABC transporter permease [Candidatus Babeliales bacterium]